MSISEAIDGSQEKNLKHAQACEVLDVGQFGERKQNDVLVVFRELRVPLFGYLVAMGAGIQEAEDLLQEAFLRFHQQLLAEVKIDNYRSWLFRVAHNLMADACATEKRRGTNSLEDLLEGGHEEATSEPSPEMNYLEQERKERMQAALNCLTSQQRQSLYLRAEGLKYKEIADVLGTSVASAGELVQRAVARLTKELHD